MGGFLQPTPTAEQRDTSRRTILVAIAVIVVLVGIVALALREKPIPPTPPPAYAASLKISDLKGAPPPVPPEPVHDATSMLDLIEP